MVVANYSKDKVVKNFNYHDIKMLRKAGKILNLNRLPRFLQMYIAFCLKTLSSLFSPLILIKFQTYLNIPSVSK